MKTKYKQDKGVGGLTIFLSLVVMMFIIGLIIMVFALMGSNMRTATYETTTVSVVNESITVPTTTGVTLAGGALRDGACATVVLYNDTGELIASGNYTQTACVLTNDTINFVEYSAPLATYSYTWSADTTATDAMNDTTVGLSGVTDWFDIFVVIGAMVVLIGLTVIIISSIRSSGLVAGAGSTSGAKSVGTA